MYQGNFNLSSALYQITVDMYPNITSVTGLEPGTADGGGSYTNHILCEFRGQNTNWVRTGIAQEGTGTRNNRYWRVRFQFYNSSFNGVFDVESARKTGNIFLPSQEIYNVNFYYQTSTTNLDVANATKIDWTTQLNLERQYDDNYNQAPVSSYTEYSTNDVSTSTTNTNVEYGTQTA
tara:strand:+ start:194 stop:724 length:531 start_codon:yes stop_codon:yes gene_type:complete